jgi:adenosylcobinamide-phosphate synthase
MAGALGIKLAGPRTYAGVAVEDQFVGDGRVEIGAADIRAAVKLYRVACGVQAAVVAVIALFTFAG